MFEIILSSFSQVTDAFLDIQLAIPSPPRNNIQIGPLRVHAYGLMIGFGMIAGVAVATRRWTARGGSPDTVVQVATWAVPAGIVGARLYHVMTDWKTYADTGWINALKITNGGLGIPGGLLFGVLFAYIAMRRLNVDTPKFLDAALPGVPIAQAVGRLGNWFNQELFGRPSDLPWAVEIDSVYRERASIPQEYIQAETFHPTFAYEAVWNILLAGLLVFVTNRKLLKPGQSLFLWIAGYGIGRFLVESLRIDPASLVWGLRVNYWVSGFAVIGGIAGLIMTRRSKAEIDETTTSESADDAEPQPKEAATKDATASAIKDTTDDAKAKTKDAAKSLKDTTDDAKAKTKDAADEGKPSLDLEEPGEVDLQEQPDDPDAAFTVVKDKKTSD